MHETPNFCRDRPGYTAKKKKVEHGGSPGEVSGLKQAKKKASTRAGLKNTGSNVSNVVPSTSEPQTVAFRELPGDDNSYQYRL
ncbi:hypothetical protein QDR00_14050 [Serratia ureilytica]|uniref:hypothetical protein n=1 Tax=Serratia ureilytica TaxID=300181 RepID=UPI00334BB0B9